MSSLASSTLGQRVPYFGLRILTFFDIPPHKLDDRDRVLSSLLLSRQSAALVNATMAIQRYPLSIHSWPTETEPIRICCARSGEQFASFPLEFVATSGVSSWEFIVTVVVELVRPISGFQPVIRDSNGRMMQGAMPVLAGTYTFEQIGRISVTISSHLSLTAAGSATPAAMARGPEYHRRSIPPSAEGSMSTRSNSSRSTAHQVSTGPDAKGGFCERDLRDSLLMRGSRDFERTSSPGTPLAWSPKVTG